MTQEFEDKVLIHVFYTQEDKKLFQAFEKHAYALRNSSRVRGLIGIEIDTEIETKREIFAQDQLADIIVLLISSDFLHLSLLDERLLLVDEISQRNNLNLLRIIPVILKPVNIENTFFSKYSALPKDQKPVTRWQNRDEAFVDVVRGISEVVEVLIKLKYQVKLGHYKSFAKEIIEKNYFEYSLQRNNLREMKAKLFLKDEDVENINTEILSRYQKKLDDFKESYLEEARHESPYLSLNKSSIKKLQQLQQHLGLPCEHVSIVVNPISKRIKDELEAKKANLKKAVREKIAQEYPSISDTSLEFLRSKQQSLLIRDEDFNKILRTSRVEEYKKRCQEYIEAFNEAFEQEGFIGNSQRQFLRGKQDYLGLSDSEVFVIEPQQIRQLNTDEIDEEIEEITQDSPNIPDTSFVNLWEDIKNIGWDSHESFPILFWMFIIFIFYVFSSITITSPRGSSNLEKTGAVAKPNQDSQTTRNPFNIYIDSESSTKNISEDQIISIIKSWLALKSSAFGATYDTRQAGKITTDYQYQKLINSVKWLRERKSYVQYKQLKIGNKAELFKVFGDKIEIHLNVVEKSARYEAGNWYPQTESYSKAYGLKLTDGRWKIAQESRADTEELFVFRRCFFQGQCPN